MKSIEFRIKNLATTQFAIFDTPEEVSLSRFSLKLDCAFGIDREKRELGCRLSITVSLEDNPAIKIEASMIYELSEKTFNGFVADNVLVIPQEITALFVVKLYDTMRGILFGKLSSTAYSQFLLPSINMKEFVDEPLELSLDAEAPADN